MKASRGVVEGGGVTGDVVGGGGRRDVERGVSRGCSRGGGGWQLHA